MSQRSQIYVIYKDNQNRDCISATYFQWNYGERMISRARYTMEWIKGQVTDFTSLWCTAHKLRYIESVNFDYKDVVIGTDLIEEWKDFKDKYNVSLENYIFHADNNNGCLIIDARNEKNLKYAFTTYDIFNSPVMGPEAYLNWDDVPQKIRNTKFTKRNINWITHNAKLMKKKELEAILKATYHVS